MLTDSGSAMEWKSQPSQRQVCGPSERYDWTERTGCIKNITSGGGGGFDVSWSHCQKEQPWNVSCQSEAQQRHNCKVFFLTPSRPVLWQVASVSCIPAEAICDFPLWGFWHSGRYIDACTPLACLLCGAGLFCSIDPPAWGPRSPVMVWNAPEERGDIISH